MKKRNFSYHYFFVLCLSAYPIRTTQCSRTRQLVRPDNTDCRLNFGVLRWTTLTSPRKQKKYVRNVFWQQMFVIIIFHLNTKSSKVSVKYRITQTPHDPLQILIKRFTFRFACERRVVRARLHSSHQPPHEFREQLPLKQLSFFVCLGLNDGIVSAIP